MLCLLPSTLCSLLILSDNVVARPERFIAQRRYLNSSAPAILPIAPPTTILESEDPTRTSANTSALTISSASAILDEDVPLISPPTFTRGFVAPTSQQDSQPTVEGESKPEVVEDGQQKPEEIEEGQTKPEEGDIKTDDDVKVDPTTIYITARPPYATATRTYGNYTYTLNGTTTQTTSCTTRKAGEASTVYIILPNPSTVTVTIGGNYTTSLPPELPEFTPPVYCPTTTSTSIRFTPSFVPPTAKPDPTTTKSKSQQTGGGGAPETGVPPPPDEDTTVGAGVTSTRGPSPAPSGQPITTIITTSKNPVTEFTTISPLFPDNFGGPKSTVLPSSPPGSDGSVNRPGNQPPNDSQYIPSNNGPSNNPPQNNPSNPSQNPPVSGVGTGGQGVPNFGSGGAQSPILTNVRGVAVEIGSTQAIIGGTTVRYTNPTQGAVSGNGGPGAPANNVAVPTNVVIIDGGIFSAIGSSVAVFDGQTIYYNNGATTTTQFHREQITLGAAITFDGTTIGGLGNSGTTLGIAGGISVTQIGQSLAVISSSSLIVGPQAVVTTVIINQYTIVANEAGLEVDGTSLSYPFQPVTQYITVGDVVMTQIGSSLLVLEGTTYTIGGTSGPASAVNNRQSITIASSSAISTISSVRSSTSAEPSAVEPAPASATSKKSGGNNLRPTYTILAVILSILCTFGV